MAIDFSGDTLAMLADSGESVTYTPLGGTARTITAIIDRQEVSTINGSEPQRQMVITVVVANDATLGIASSAINLGGDTITLPVRYGNTATQRRIARIIDHDQGALTLELQ